MRQKLLDGDELLEATQAALHRDEHLGHAALGDLRFQLEVPECAAHGDSNAKASNPMLQAERPNRPLKNAASEG